MSFTVEELIKILERYPDKTMRVVVAPEEPVPNETGVDVGEAIVGVLKMPSEICHEINSVTFVPGFSGEPYIALGFEAAE